jgi:hypothetical protein
MTRMKTYLRKPGGRNGHLLDKLVVVLILATLAGCAASEPLKGNACLGNFLPGDLVISEIMANPDGADEGKEWIEIYNATDKVADLSGLKVQVSATDGTGEKAHVMQPAQIVAGQYFVLGGVLPAVKPAYVDYAFGADLGAMRNNGGHVVLLCVSTTVDSVTYGETKDGVAQEFDGAKVPDAVANDSQQSWCDAQTEFEAPAKGTPGKKNDPCQAAPPPSTCLEGGQPRSLVVPGPGDLVITEIMANPKAAGEPDGEWLELHVSKDMDLNGLQAGKAADKLTMNISSTDCLAVKAGSYVILAAKADSTLNGGLPKVDAEVNLSLSNAGGSIFLGYDGTVLDSVTYGTASEGVSLSLEPTKMTTEANDLAESWCKGQEPYGAGDKGSPGEANPSCGFVEKGQCLDMGKSRDKVAPVVGDLVITEFLANPKTISDDAGEWFELYVARDVDLNGLQLGKTLGTIEQQLPEGECLRATKDSYLLFAREANSANNGGLPTVSFGFNFSLNNSNSGIWVGLDGAVLDQITYVSVGDGIASSLGKAHQSPVDNDDSKNWCPAIEVYGTADNKGSPQKENPECP